MGTKINRNPVIGLFAIEGGSENTNYVEKQSHESTALRFGSYMYHANIDVETTYFYESGRSSSHHTSIELTGGQCREIAALLLGLAEAQETREAEAAPEIDRVGARVLE